MNHFESSDFFTEEQREEFVLALEEAINPQMDEDVIAPNCLHDYNLAHTRRILDQMGFETGKIEEILEFFKDHGGYCDCEVMLNVVCGFESLHCYYE